MPPLIHPSAEPFFIPGGPTACILVHGFTGSPKEMRGLGEQLGADGHTVLGLRLPGHATQSDDLQRVRWRDWIASVEDSWHLLQGQLEPYPAGRRSVFVVGLSLGGVIALVFASHTPVSGVVAISTPYTLPSDMWKWPSAYILRFLRPQVEKGPADWHDASAAQDHVAYPRYPRTAAFEIRELLAVMRSRLARVTSPVLVVHSKEDTVVSPENAQRLFDELTTSDKHILWVADSGHVVVREPPRGLVFKAVSEFVARLAM